MKPAPKFRDISGARFGKLVIIERAGSKQTSKKSRQTIWRCRCDCGGERLVVNGTLQSGRATSCGCARRGRGAKDGKRTATYVSWQNMIGRCTNPNATGYDHYKKLGITVCERWRTFDNFLADMGERPDRSFTLDRIDNNGNYEPNNCRWATKQRQANNRRTNILFNYRGAEYTLADLARATGVQKETLRCRLVRPGGWSVEDAINTPTIPRNMRKAGLSKRTSP